MLIWTHLVVMRFNQTSNRLFNAAHFDQSHFWILKKLELNNLAMRAEQISDNTLDSTLWNITQMQNIAWLVNILVVLASLLPESVQMVVTVILGQVMSILTLVFRQINFLVLRKFKFHFSSSKFHVVQVLQSGARLLRSGELDQSGISFFVEDFDSVHVTVNTEKNEQIIRSYVRDLWLTMWEVRNAQNW